MKGLLDTHVLIWWLTDNERLSQRSREFIANRDNELFFSCAGVWEMVIKSKLKRVKLPIDPNFLNEQLVLNHIQTLPIQMNHVINILKMDWHHNDPFDHIMVSQAQCENLVFLTRDKLINKYRVKILW
jgi:PIN domain nuclease of toxin-antitoxin system